MLRRRRTGNGKAKPQAVVYELSQGKDYEAHEMQDQGTDGSDDDARKQQVAIAREELLLATTNSSLGSPTVQPADLAPLQSKLGLYEAFVRGTPETIVMREQWSWVGDEFEIATVDGREVLNMRARFWSFSLRKGQTLTFHVSKICIDIELEFLAPNGDPLFTLRFRLTRLLRSYYLDLPSGETVLDMPQHWGWMHSRFSVTFRNAFSGEKATLQIEGDFWNRKARITWDGQPVARIRRQYRNWRGLSGRHTFLLDVAPGVDLALVSCTR